MGCAAVRSTVADNGDDEDASRTVGCATVRSTVADDGDDDDVMTMMTTTMTMTMMMLMMILPEKLFVVCTLG